MMWIIIEEANLNSLKSIHWWSPIPGTLFSSIFQNKIKIAPARTIRRATTMTVDSAQPNARAVE